MKVVFADIDEANLTKVESEQKTRAGTVLGVRTDVSKRSEVELLARQALDAFGQVHLLFKINGVKVFTPLMLRQNTECHIINTSSAAGLVAGGGSAPCAVTKHASSPSR